MKVSELLELLEKYNDNHINANVSVCVFCDGSGHLEHEDGFIPLHFITIDQLVNYLKESN